MGLSDCTVESAIAVSDLATARHFYEAQLGLEPGEQEPGESIRYPCGNGTRLFIYRSPEHAGRSPATAAGWIVEDLDATIDELGARGVTFEEYDQPGIKTDSRRVFDAGRFRAAWIRDPDGNTLAITQVG